MRMILNRVKDEQEAQRIKDNAPINVLGWMREDDLIREYDLTANRFSIFQTHPKPVGPWRVLWRRYACKARQRLPSFLMIQNEIRSCAHINVWFLSSVETR